MYRNQTKAYYVTTSNSGGGSNGGGNTNTNAFILIASSLVDAYNKSEKTTYDNLMNALNDLKNTNVNYLLDTTSNTVVTLINVINSLIITKDDILSQLRTLELEELHSCKSSIAKLTEKKIEQNSSIKLVYLQYLLMYDITLTNGNFIDEYLLEAQKVLDENGGLLKHF